MRKIPFLLFLFLFLALTLTPIVHAEDDDVNLAGFPTALSEQLDIDLFPAQILATMIVVLLCLLPTLVMTRNPVAPLVVGMISLCFCLALGWLPIYVLIIITFLVAALVGEKFVRILT